MIEAADKHWVRFAYVYTALVVFGVGYFLYDLPIQVSDSYGNLVEAADGTLGSLVSRQFYSRAYLRPLLWANIRVVYDLSGGHYFEWFRGWHVAQVALLGLLFLRLVRPSNLSGASVVPLGLAALIGIHTFAGAVLEAFPINTFMTIVLCCFAAAALALGPPHVWRDVAALVLLVFASLTVESGLLVAVIFVAAFLAGARGVSRRGITAVVLLVAAYFVLRFVVLEVGAPGLEERSSGFGFSRLSPNQLNERFGESPVPFYLYNVVTSFLSLLFSEPREGVWVVTRDLMRGEPLAAGLINVLASSLATLSIGIYLWQRRHDWLARRFDRDDQLVVVFLAVAAANSVLSYPYTKDVILSPAGAFLAVALTVATRHLIESATGAAGLRKALTLALVLTLSCAWSFRAVGIHVALREAGGNVRDEWVYVDEDVDGDDNVTTPVAARLKQQLQDDAIRNHPARTAVMGEWLEWFAEE